MSPDLERERRAARARRRARLRRNRRIAAGAAAAVALAAAGFLLSAEAGSNSPTAASTSPRDRGTRASAATLTTASTARSTSAASTTTTTTEATTGSTSTSAPATSTTAGSTPTTGGWTLASPPAGLHLVKDLIPYPSTRLAEMAAYSQRHYGVDSWRLRPKVIVLHFTASSTYASAHATFASNAPNLGEEPGTCAHYVVDQDGTVYEQVPPTIQCRHTIGLNAVAIGIENVQVTGPSSHWADQQILHRPAQIGADLRLVKWLQAVFHIPTGSVIGHAMANDSPLFVDHEGWRNDHTDWQPEDVAQFRALLLHTRIAH